MVKKTTNYIILLGSNCALKGMWACFAPRVSAQWASKHASQASYLNMNTWRDYIFIIMLKGAIFESYFCRWSAMVFQRNFFFCSSSGWKTLGCVSILLVLLPSAGEIVSEKQKYLELYIKIVMEGMALTWVWLQAKMTQWALLFLVVIEGKAGRQLKVMNIKNCQIEVTDFLLTTCNQEEPSPSLHVNIIKINNYLWMKTQH